MNKQQKQSKLELVRKGCNSLISNQCFTISYEFEKQVYSDCLHALEIDTDSPVLNSLVRLEIADKTYSSKDCDLKAKLISEINRVEDLEVLKNDFIALITDWYDSTTVVESLALGLDDFIQEQDFSGDHIKLFSAIILRVMYLTAKAEKLVN